MKQRAKCGGKIYFSVKEMCPFNAKIHNSQQLGKKHPSPQQGQKGIMQREVSELPATLALGSHKTSVNLSTVSLRLHSCSDDGAERKALTDSCGRKNLKRNCGQFIGMSVVAVRFQCKTSKMCNSCCQSLGVV